MEEISLREIIETVLKGKWILIAVIVVCMLVAPLGAFVLNPVKGQAKAIITLSFKGIENGQNPDGSKFDINKIKSPVVMQKVIEELKLDPNRNSVDTLSNGISIDPIIPDDIVKQTEALMKEGKDLNYFPTKYVITYTFNKSQKISMSTGRNILRSIIENYQEYFNDLYSDKAVLANAIGPLNYDEYDYPEVARVMNNQLNIAISFLSGKAAEAGDFRSKITGMTFKDIQETLTVLRDIDVNRMASLISAVNLTKNKERLITSYEYLIKMDELERAKKESEAKVNQDAMANFKREQNLLLVPGLGNEKLQTENNQSYYDQLAKQATEAGVMAQNYYHEIEFYKQEIEKLRNDVVSAEIKAAAEADVQAMLPGIKQKMEYWINVANQTAADYYEFKYGKSINSVADVQVGPVINLKLITAIGFVLGVMLGLFIVFFREYWIKSAANSVKEKEAEQAV